MNVHIVGDSHGLQIVVPGVTVHNLGPHLAHTLRRHKHEFMDVMAVDPEGFYWISAGEVDCRVHIFPRLVNFGGKVSLAVEAQMQPFLELVFEFSQAYHVGVLCVPPAGPLLTRYGIKYYGTHEDRLAISEEWNRQLCSKMRVSVLQMWPEGTRFPHDEYEDDIHVNVPEASAAFVLAGGSWFWRAG